MTDFMRAVRTSRGLSQKAMADKLGVTQQSVSRWEGGVVPSAATLAEMNELLGIKPDEWRALYDAEADHAEPDHRLLTLVRLFMAGDGPPPPETQVGADLGEDIELDFNSAMQHVPEEVRQAVIRIVLPYLDEQGT